MPHLVLEYSANIAHENGLDSLFGALHTVVSVATGVDIAHFKSRARSCADFRIGDGSAGQAFVHLDIRLLDPSTDDIKRAGDAALDVLRHHLEPHLRLFAWQITVDTRALDRDTYCKATGGRRP